MKKINFIIAAAAAIIAMAPVNTTLAFSNKKAGKETKSSVSNIEVKHFAEDDNFVYLQLELMQATEKNASVRITDDLGELLYSERFKTKSHNMLVKVNPNEISYIQLLLTTEAGTTRKTVKLATKTYNTTVIEVVANK
jgi:hypothetical protein